MTGMKQRSQKWHRRRIWILKILRIVAQLSLNNMLYMYSAYSSETLLPCQHVSLTTVLSSHSTEDNIDIGFIRLTQAYSCTAATFF